MKRFLLILGAVIFVVGGLAVPAFADGEGAVEVTVTPATISVTVQPPAVNYGVVQIGATGLKPVEPYPDPWITANNTSNCWVNYLITGADTLDWDLDTSPAADTYVHYFNWSVFSDNVTDYTALDLLPQALGPFASEAPGMIRPFRLMMDTPTSTTHFEEQTTTVTVMVTMADKGISAELATDEASYLQETATANLTMTVTNEFGGALTGVSPDNFSVALWTVGQLPNQMSVSFTETDAGVYVGGLAIGGLDPGTYSVAVLVWDTSMRAARGYVEFDITAP